MSGPGDPRDPGAGAVRLPVPVLGGGGGGPGGGGPPIWEITMAPGTRIGRWEIRRVLGRGPLGILYQARDVDMHQPCALRMLRRGPDDDLPLHLRSRAWRKALALLSAGLRLEDPGIEGFVDFHLSDGPWFLAHEFLPGESLARRLRAGPLAPAEALRVAREAARVLAVVHARRWTHGALGPGRVFLCVNGEVKLLEVGLWRVLAPLGLARILPPRWKGPAPTARQVRAADVRALGLTILAMVSSLPLDELENWAPGPAMAAAAPPPFRIPIACCLESDPGRRPSAAALARRLDGLAV